MQRLLNANLSRFSCRWKASSGKLREPVRGITAEQNARRQSHRFRACIRLIPNSNFDMNCRREFAHFQSEPLPVLGRSSSWSGACVAAFKFQTAWQTVGFSAFHSALFSCVQTPSSFPDVGAIRIVKIGRIGTLKNLTDRIRSIFTTLLDYEEHSHE